MTTREKIDGFIAELRDTATDLLEEARNFTGEPNPAKTLQQIGEGEGLNRAADALQAKVNRGLFDEA